VKAVKYLFIAANEGNSWGGSEILWSAAAEKLARRGGEVRISVRDWGRPIAQVERLRSSGCLISYRRLPSLLNRLARKVSPLAEYAPSHVAALGKDVDLIVISQGANADGLQWLEAARATGRRYAIIVQGAAEHWWPHDDVAERLAEAYENASASYFVSQANLDLSRRQFVTPLCKAKVVRNPFNVRYDAQPPWPSNCSDGLSLACVARLDIRHKGQDLIVQVLSLARWRERRVRVSFVGTGLHERGLRRTVEQLKLSSVEFTGHLNDIETVWSKHHALLLPSRYEGMPLALVEAMLCGRPCIVTDVASHAELVQDGVNGFLAKAPTVELLDEAMNRAWENRQRLEEMGCTAAGDVRRWVSPDPVGDFVNELAGLVNGCER
jgi:glycosyltransferase involved in cell wall biosynthesis